jgi:hypothetical protein
MTRQRYAKRLVVFASEIFSFFVSLEFYDTLTILLLYKKMASEITLKIMQTK